MSYLFDLHVHTSEVSRCGQVKASDMVALFKERGYDGLVVTNHFTRGYIRSFSSPESCLEEYLHGFELAREAGKRLQMQILMGIELRFARTVNDFLVYGVAPDELEALLPAVEWDIPRFYEEYHDKYTIIQAHPCRTGCYPAPPRFIHGIEIRNTSHNPAYNQQAEALLRSNPDLIATAGCDAHDPSDVGLTGVTFDWLPRDEGELAQLLKDELFTIV